MKCKWVMLAAISIVIALVGSFMATFRQDTIWKWKVGRQANENDIRAWALGVIKLASKDSKMSDSQSFLTNAPSYLIRSYKRSPRVIFVPDGIGLMYGGGFSHWGLIMGNTNLPAPSLNGGYVEQWWPGIYYQSN